MPYDEAEVAQMLHALQMEPYHWRVLITVALTTGLRRNELLGLVWKHIDFYTGVIHVRQTMIHALKGKIIVKLPKTKKSVRKVSLPPRWITVPSRRPYLWFRHFIKKIGFRYIRFHDLRHLCDNSN